MTKKIFFATCPFIVVGYLFTCFFNNDWKLEIFLDLIPNSLSASQIVCLPFIGIAFGAIITGWLADHYGRKRFLTGCMAFLIAACLSIFLVNDVNSYIIVSIFIGLFMGGASTASVLYVIDSSTKKTCLKNALRLMLFFIIGQTISELVDNLLDGLLLNSQNINYSWQWIIAGAGVLGIISIILTHSLPKSDAFLNLETKQAMAVNRHNLHNSHKKHSKESRYHLQFSKKAVTTILVGALFVVVYNFIPFGDVKYYCLEALSDAGLNLKIQNYIYFFISLIGLISVIGALLFIKVRYYARVLVIFSVGLAVIMTLIAFDLLFNLYSETGIIISVVLIVLYSITYSISWFAIGWAVIFSLFAGEKFARIRGVSIGLMLFIDWILSYLSDGLHFLAGLHLSTPGWLIFYSVIAIIAAIIVRHFLKYSNIKVFARGKVNKSSET